MQKFISLLFGLMFFCLLKYQLPISGLLSSSFCGWLKDRKCKNNVSEKLDCFTNTIDIWSLKVKYYSLLVLVNVFTLTLHLFHGVEWEDLFFYGWFWNLTKLLLLLLLRNLVVVVVVHKAEFSVFELNQSIPLKVISLNEKFLCWSCWNRKFKIVGSNPTSSWKWRQTHL